MLSDGGGGSSNGSGGGGGAGAFAESVLGGLLSFDSKAEGSEGEGMEAGSVGGSVVASASAGGPGGESVLTVVSGRRVGVSGLASIDIASMPDGSVECPLEWDSMKGMAVGQQETNEGR